MKRIIDFVAKHPVIITALVCFIFYFLPFKPKPFGDGEYHEGTIQLIQFVLNGFQGDVRVDKGLFTLFYYFVPYSFAYVFHNAAVYYLFGIVFNSIMTCLAIKYLFASFDLMGFSKKSKFWSIIILTLFPIHVYYCMGILAEAGSFLSVCLIVYVWIKIVTLKSRSKTDFMLLAFAVVMLVGFRPNLLPFAFLFLIYFLALKTDLQHKLIFAGSLGVLMLFLMFTEKGLSNNDGEFKKNEFRKQLLWSRFELRDEPFNWLPQHGHDGFESSDYLHNLAKRKELDSICDANKLDKTVYYINWVKNDIIHNPVLTVRQYTLKFFQSQSFIISPLMKSNKSNWVKYGIHIYINGINYMLIFFSIMAIIIVLRKKEYIIVFPLLLLWGWSLLYVFIFHSEQRYMFPVRPALIFLFAYYVNYYFDKKSPLKEVS
ncbi:MULTISPECIES: hypothetical protein [unclassified Flavobacterium]|jgi:hypothetical protein|uniref:hypothetical protein n=1 Tax=unclassified Flavobacterium TaxID=196869 RepID=UPI0025B91022|nr:MULTISPECIES: hypothetical protein [unclassified Flavobacterium]